MRICVLFVSACPDFTKELSSSHSSLLPFQLRSSMMQMHYCHVKCSWLTWSESLLICVFPIHVTIFHYYFLLWLISHNFSWLLRLSLRRWKHNFISQVDFFIWVYCLANRVWHRSCCYSYLECPNSHRLSERAQSSEAQHVPGDQSGNCRYLYWRPFDLAWLVVGKLL